MSAKRRTKRRARDDAPTPRAMPPSFARGWMIHVALTLLIVVVYVPVASHQFVNWDDPEYVSDNAVVARGLTWPGIAWAFTGAHAANWHPVTWLSHMLDVQLFGVSAGAHHVVNVVLHIATTLLLFGWLSRATGSMGRSGAVAALFAVHPLHVESVAWISERKDTLSTLLWVLTMWAYLYYVARPSIARYAAVVVSLALGLMAKPMVVTLPLVLLLLDVWPLRRVQLDDFGDANRRTWLRLAGEKAPLLGLSIGSAVATFIAQSTGGAVQRLDAFPLSMRVENAMLSYAAYIVAMFWPTRLAVVYPTRIEPPISILAAAVALIVAITVLAIREARRRPYLLIGWLWYAGTLVPVIGLVQVGSQSMADRYTYVPLIGLFIIVAWGVPDLVARWPVPRFTIPLAATITLAICAAVARVQVTYWHDNVSLWTHALAVTRENPRAHNNLANALTERRMTVDAIAHYREAIRLKPNFGEAHGNLANTLVTSGQTEEAEREYLAALRFRPNDPYAHNGLGFILDERGKLPEAIAHYKEALRVAPEMAEVHNNLATALAKQGRVDDAIREFRAALQLRPTKSDVNYNLGVMYDQKGDRAEARRFFETALALDPTSQNARRALDAMARTDKR